jgi:Cu+-exporting ATPase
MSETVVDPVCGMEIARESAAATAKHKGRTYYFCAPSCRDEFERSPERFVPDKGKRRPEEREPRDR